MFYAGNHSRLGQCGVCVGGHTGRPEYEVYRLGDTDNPRDIRYYPLRADCDGNCVQSTFLEPFAERNSSRFFCRKEIKQNILQ